jgi:putative DNA primase/helicase
MNVFYAAKALGGDIAGRDRVLCPGPGHSPQDRSLSVTLDPNAPNGFRVHSFANDDWKDCRDHVRQMLGLPAWEPGDGQNRTIPPSKVPQWDMSAVGQEAEDRRRTEDDLIRIKRAQELWDEAGEPRGTLAEAYLRSRCLKIGEYLSNNVLRFHPRCPWRDENTGRTVFLPAMIAAFRSIDDDRITAVHRIALKPDGSKIGRRMLGVVQRAAVKMDPVGPELAIGEGIETCMAARQLGLKVPVWALGSVGAISFFPVIASVKRLHILAEAGKASDQAIHICGKRWIGARLKVTAHRPEVGNDANDELIARAGQ